MVARVPLADRFERLHIPEPNSGCWIWTGSLSRQGYGQIRMAKTGPGQLRCASHIALELAGRPLPAGLFACHKCDNPPCVNPDHLFPGTQVDNIQDAKRKGRHSPPPIAKPGCGKQTHCFMGHPLEGSNLLTPPSGRKCRECLRRRKREMRERFSAQGLTSRGTPKLKRLTAQIAAEIRQSSEPNKKSAAEHGVSGSLIGQIKRNVVWRTT